MKNICLLFSFIISFSVSAQKISQLENYVLKDYKTNEESDEEAQQITLGLKIHTVVKKINIVFPIKYYEGGVRVWIGNKCVLNKKKLKQKSSYYPPFSWLKTHKYYWFRKKLKKIGDKQITVLNLYSGEYIQFNISSTHHHNLYIDLMYSKKQKKYYWHLIYKNSLVVLKKPNKRIKK